MEFVIKISKLCNLRCSYCYEYAYLGDKKRMSLAEIRVIFEKTAELLQYKNIDSAKFIWHGGEPLLIEPEYYEAIWKIQSKIFNPLSITTINSIQTNLTLLSDAYLQKIKDGIFDSIGVSYDVVGNHRVNIGGKPMKEKTLENMKRLIDNGIEFGIITVLTNESAEYAEEIYDYFDEKGISISFLPLFQTRSGTQPLKESIPDTEVVKVYRKLFDRWLSSPKATRVLPLDYYMDDVLDEIGAGKKKKQKYDRDKDEWIWVINTDGNVYPYDDEYKPELSYGNIFTESTSTILNSTNRKRIVEQSRNRIREVCTHCKHLDIAPGIIWGIVFILPMIKKES